MRRAGSVFFVFVLIVAGVSVTALAARYDAAHTRAATTVKASEVEWGIKASAKSGRHGKITFAVHDAGKLAHQFIVLRTNLPARQAATARRDRQPGQGWQGARQDHPLPGQEQAADADAKSGPLCFALQPPRPLPSRTARRLPGQITA